MKLAHFPKCHTDRPFLKVFCFNVLFLSSLELGALRLRYLPNIIFPLCSNALILYCKCKILYQTLFDLDA